MVPEAQLDEILAPIEAIFAISAEEFARMQAAYQGGVLSAL